MDANYQLFGNQQPGAVPEYDPSAPLQYPGSDRGDHFASKTRAVMARDIWEDYQARFEPYERELLDRIQNPEEELEARLSAISINTDNAFQVARESADRLRGQYGTTQNVHQRVNDHRSSRQAAALTRVNAENRTREHIRDRNMQYIAGGGARQAIEDV